MNLKKVLAQDWKLSDLFAYYAMEKEKYDID